MTDASEGAPDQDRLLSYLRRATTDARDARRRVAQLEAQLGEPMAVVGIGCRYPGGIADPEGLWALVADGRDAVGEAPDDRGWSPSTDGDPVRLGGFLDDVAGFDAGFFRVGPREARAMDPQQRLWLEVAWEAIEHAGIDPASLHGSRTGVFVGVATNDYGPPASRSPTGLAGLRTTGSLSSVVSGRLSYLLGLQGPAVSVDTACSSSLTALHLGCQALRGGECDLALVGGVTVMSTPWMFSSFGEQGALASDGRCKSYGQAADGMGWAEGAGVLVLARLADARRDGRRVLGVVRGSALNQDGESQGLSAPNGAAQHRVIADALAAADLRAGDVDLVEGHGTGTVLGDPIEVRALQRAYADRGGRPLWLGSLKSNIGHSGAASGVGGVIKVLMAMRHGVMPASLHADEPSSRVSWDDGPVRLLTAPRPWTTAGGPRRAAVSGFGMSGTNAHVILEEAGGTDGSGPPVPAVVRGDAVAWPLSSRTPEGLRAEARRFAAHARAGAVARATAEALGTRRGALTHRAVVVAAEDALPDALEALADGRPSTDAVAGAGRTEETDGVVFVFPGQGGQWDGMGRTLWATSPPFAKSMERCAAALEPHVDWRLREVIEDGTSYDRVDVVQPVLFALMVSLAHVWQASGVRPAAVVGHSQGEIAAAVVAGRLTLEDGARIVAVRAAALASLSPGAGMLAVEASPEHVARMSADAGADVQIAAHNGSTSVVMAGSETALDRLHDAATAAGIRASRLPVGYAAHSPQVDEVADVLRARIGEVRSTIGTVPMCSTVSAGMLGAEDLGADYWVRNLRSPVRFAEAVDGLMATGHRRFVEVGPHPVLGIAVEAAAEDRGIDPADMVVTGSLRRDRDEAGEILRALATLWVAGGPVDWGLVGGTGEPWTDLPSRAFVRRRHWMTDTHPSVAGASTHPMVEAVAEVAGNGTVTLTGRISTGTHPWLADHASGGIVLVPGAAFVELLLQAASAVGAGSISGVVLESPLRVDSGAAYEVQAAARPAVDGRWDLTLHARRATSGSSEPWTALAHARTASGAETVPPASPVGGTVRDPDAFYADLRARGLEYGPAFRGILTLRDAEDTAWADVRLADDVTDADRYALHPALLDAALHPSLLLLAGPGGDAVPRPIGYDLIEVLQPGARELQVRIDRRVDGTVDLVGWSAGEPAVVVTGLHVRWTRSDASSPGDLHHVVWEAAPASAAAMPAPSAVVALGPEAAARVAGVHAAATVAEIAALEDLPAVAVHAAPPGEPELTGAVHQTTEVLLRVLQQWLDEPSLDGIPLIVLTSGADGATTDGLADAASWGLVRSAQAEHPGRFVLLDVPDGRVDLAILGCAIGGGEPQLALRDGTLEVPRLVPLTPREPTRSWPSGTALITGGTGTLGAHVARHLVRVHGVRDVVLVSRRGPDAPGAKALLDELRALGARPVVERCDVSDRDDLAAVLSRIPADRPLRTVVHTAAVLADAPLSGQTAGALHAVLRPKVDAAWALHELTASMELEAFVLFSSVAGTFLGLGQANYAAGNAFLDALARHRRVIGLPGCALPWGYWAETSEMTGTLGASDRSRLARLGILPMTTERGLQLLDTAVATGEAVVAPVALDRVILRDRAARRAGSSLFWPVAPVETARTGPPPASHGGPAPLAGMEDLAVVRRETARLLGHASADDVDPRTPFVDLGFDSLLSVELRNALVDLTGIRLPPTLVFDHPTPEAVGRRIASLRTPDRPVAVPDRLARLEDEGIAVVGIGLRLPGGVSSPDDLWDLVSSGTDAIGPFPDDRGWNVGPDFRAARVGGFVDGADRFDAAFFGISPREATAMDPQQRLWLQTSWEALEHAGIVPDALRGSNTAVFAGVMLRDYVDATDGGSVFGVGTASSVVSGRLSYLLGLEGPSATVDSACSSSLVALHLAAQALRSRECDLALAGGVTIMSTPAMLAGFERQGTLASDGRCKSFADAADGTGFGEGVGVLVLERLSDARRAGRRILGVVRGSAVNQDGATNGLSAPSGRAQRLVVARAVAAAGFDARDIDLVEGHGTGTVLGDPIEAQALVDGLGAGRAEQPLWLGSLKSNVGHTGAAAGVAGIAKVLMAMRHTTMPATLHVDSPASAVSWGAAPAVRLLDEARPWEASGPRRAGVSAFGVSGTNAHVVLEEAPDDPPATPDAEPLLVGGPIALVVSARRPEALRGQAAALAKHLRERDDSVVAVAAALATRRAAHDHRAVALGRDRRALVEALDALAAGVPDPRVVTADPLGPTTSGPLLLFPGQGSQETGMVRELLHTCPTFASAMDDCARALEPEVDWSLLDVLDHREDLLDRVDVVQPVLFAIMVSLARVWEAAGLTPGAVIGHSQGEIAAATIAGALTLEDGARIVARRSRGLRELSGAGGMISLACGDDRASALADRTGAVVAVRNGPESTVLAGTATDLSALELAAEAAGIRFRRLPVDYAAHSPQIDRLRASLAASLAGVRPDERTTVAQYSTVTGERVPTGELGGAYWFRNLREPVDLGAAVVGAINAGARHIVEVSPHPLLTAAVERIVDDHADHPRVTVHGTLRRDVPDTDALVSAFATAWVAGAELDWGAVLGGGQPWVELPTYAFRTERFWGLPVEPADRLRALRWEPVKVAQGGGPPVVVGAGPRLPGATHHEDLPALLTVDEMPPRLVLRPATGGDDADVARECCASIATVCQALLAEPRLDGTVLVVLTNGGAGLSVATNAAHAAVWGLVRAAQAEHPGRFRLVDAASDASSADVISALGADLPQLAVNCDGVHAPDLRPVRTTQVEPGRTQGTVLITGGTGTLGALVAQRLVAEHEVSDLVLLSRRGDTAPGAAELVADLQALGATVRIVTCDVGDREQLAHAVREAGPLRGIVHTAGVRDDALLGDTTPEQLERVFTAKAGAAWTLHELTRDHDLEMFVLFSSAAGLLGGMGQTGYCAANAYLDGLARRRRAQGLSAVSIGWGYWAERSGLTGGLRSTDLERFARQGIRPLPTAAALSLFDTALRSADPAVVAARLDENVVRATLGGGDPSSGWITPVDAPSAAPPAARSTADVVELVIREIAVVLGHRGTGQVDPRRSFKDLGFDSLTSVELRNRLAAVTGLPLTTTLAFDYPDARSLAGHLARRLGIGDEPDQHSDDLHGLLDRIGIDRLRSSGLLEPLLALGATDFGPEPAADAPRTDDLDDLDVDSLIQRAMGEQQ